MSDTPRTDAAEINHIVANQGVPDKDWLWAAITAGWQFARELERELNAAKAALSGRTVSCSNCNALAAENAEMRESIKEAHEALARAGAENSNEATDTQDGNKH